MTRDATVSACGFLFSHIGFAANLVDASPNAIIPIPAALMVSSRLSTKSLLGQITIISSDLVQHAITSHATRATKRRTSPGVLALGLGGKRSRLMM